MASRRHLAVLLAACLLANAFAVPADMARRRRGLGDNELDGDMPVSFGTGASNSAVSSTASTTTMSFDSFDSDEDEDFSEPMQAAPTSGSNLFSLLRLAGSLFPSSSGATQESTGGQTQQQTSPLWTFKMDILRAILQFGTTIIGMSSASSTNAITT